MSRIAWDQTGERYYETGVSKGVLYPERNLDGSFMGGVPWNGLTAVTESPSGAESTALYADDIKYLNLISNEEFGGTIEAYTYPDAFMECDGSAEIVKGVVIGQQSRKTFGLCYRTTLGNDTENNDYGYKLHLIYNALAAPSEKGFSTINDSPEAITFSWEITTTPVNVTGFKPTACLTIDSTKVSSAKLAKLEAILYGDDESQPRLPLPDEVAALLGGDDELEAPTELAKVPAQDYPLLDSSKNTSDLIGDDVVIHGDGSVTGTINYISSWQEFDSSTVANQSGYYFPVLLDERYDGKNIKCVGSHEKSVEDTEWILRLSNKENSKFVFSTDDEPDFLTLTFTGATFTGED